jgi:hypothetical protein
MRQVCASARLRSMSRNREHGAAPLLQAGARPVSQPPTPCSINVGDLRILARAGRNSDWKSVTRARAQRLLAERAGMVGAASPASRVSRRVRKRAVFSRTARRPAWYSAMAFWPSRSCASFFLKLASATSCACLAFIFKAAAPLDSAQWDPASEPAVRRLKITRGSRRGSAWRRGICTDVGRQRTIAGKSCLAKAALTQYLQ